MSTKTAEDWIKEGDELDDQGKSDEAIACFDKAIAINPHIARAHFLKGYVLAGKELKDQALFCLDRAIEIKPDYDTALNSKADILSSQGKHKEAVEFWDKAIAANPNYAIAIHNKGNSQRSLGNNDDALASYDKALQIKPDYANCYYSKAFTLNNMSRYSDVVDCLNKLLPLTPNDARAHNLMANSLVKLDKIQESIEYYTKAIQAKPGTPLYFCNRGVAYAKLGRRKEALEDFMKAQELLDKGILGENTSAGNVSFMKETLGPVSELHKISELNEVAVRKLDQRKPEVQKFVAQLKKMQEDMNKVIDEIFLNMDNKAKSNIAFKAELDRLKTEFQDQFKLMQPEKEANTKSAEELIKKGDALDDEGKTDEAIKCFDQAIALDPYIARAHFLKGYVLAAKGLKDQALFCLDRAIELKPDYDTALNSKADILSSQGKHKEAVETWDLAITANPTYSIAIHNKGNSQKALGNYEQALVSYDKALQIKPDYANCYYSKAFTLNELARYSEVVECLKKLFELTPDDARALNLMANSFVKLDKIKESIEYYTKAITAKPDTPLYFCNRGDAYNKLNKKKEALQDFLKAKDLLDKGILGENISAGNVRFMKETLGALAELQKVADENDAEMKKLDQDNPIVKKFVNTFKKLQEQKNKVTDEVIQQFGNKGSAGTPDFKAELDRLKAEYKNQFEMLQAELKNVKADVNNIQIEMKELKGAVDSIKEELNNKLDDFNKKLDSELLKQDLNPENRAKIKEYFKAFLETFSSTHVTAQVVDSGQVSLNGGSTQVTILSTIASFAPFIGSALSEGVKTLGDFLKSRELIKSARKMKALAPDATALSQIIGKVALQISLNKNKQQEIIKATEQDLRKVSGSLILKIQKLCENLTEDVDAFLYTRLYNTPAAMIGHQDANRIIQKWVEGMVPFDIQSQFLEVIVGGSSSESKPKEDERPKEATETKNEEKKCYCSMF